MNNSPAIRSELVETLKLDLVSPDNNHAFAPERLPDAPSRIPARATRQAAADSRAGVGAQPEAAAGLGLQSQLHEGVSGIDARRPNAWQPSGRDAPPLSCQAQVGQRRRQAPWLRPFLACWCPRKTSGSTGPCRRG